MPHSLSAHSTSNASTTVSKKQQRRHLLEQKLLCEIRRRLKESGRNADDKTMRAIQRDLENVLTGDQLLENDIQRLVAKARQHIDAHAAAVKEHDREAIRTHIAAHHEEQRMMAQTAPAAPPATDNNSFQAKRGVLIPQADLHTMAQHVRSLPPLLQKRLMVQRQQGPWSELLQKEKEEHYQEVHNQYKKQQMQIQEQRQFLDMQVKKHEAEKIVEKQKVRAQMLEEDAQRKIWESEQEEEIRRRKEETAQLAKELKEQRDAAVLKKKIEAERLKKEEHDKLIQLQNELSKEENEKKLFKDKVKVEIREFLKFNEVLMAKKDEEKAKIIEQDIKALKAYDEKLDKQENERRENLRQLQEKQTKHYTQANLRYQNWQEQLKKDELKAEEHQIYLENKRKAEDDKKRQTQLVEAKKIKESVMQQINEKERLKEIARQESQKLRKEVAANVQRAEEQEQRRKQEARQFAIQGLHDIDKQLIELHTRRFQSQNLKVGERNDRPKFLSDVSAITKMKEHQQQLH
jgi:hypothetical protein